MPREEDLLFLRTAVEAGALEARLADEVAAALAQVEALGATSSAREIVVNRGLMTPAQVEQALAACGPKAPTQPLPDRSRPTQGRAAGRATTRSTTPLSSRKARRRRRSPMLVLFAVTGVFIATVGGWLLLGAAAGTSERPRAAAGSPPDAQAAPRAGERPPAARPGRASSSEEEAQAELGRARQWAATEGKDPKAVLRRLKSVAYRFPNSAAAQEAMGEVQKIEAALAAEKQKALDEAVREARSLAAAKKYAAAVEFLDKLADECPDFAGRAGEERGLVLSAAMQADREMREQARRAAEKGDFAAAIGLYRQVAAFGIPSLAARAKHEVTLLEEKAAAAARKARAEAEEAYLALRVKLLPLAEARDYGQARALLAEGRESPELAPVRAELEADLRDLDTVAALWAAAERAARALRPNEELTVGGIRGAFVRFEKGVIEVRASKLVCKKPLAELPTKEVLALATREMAAAEPATRLACALFWLAEGKPKEAAAIAEGGKAGDDAKRLLALIERRRSDAREAEAEAAFAQAEELIAAGKWRPAADALRALEQQFPGTRSFARNRARAEELALQARLATLDLPDLFRGACRVVGAPRRVELSYDFRSAEQLADWDLRGAHWAVEDGRLTLRGAQALLRAPVERDLHATLQLADASGPPGEWGLSLAQAIGTPPLCAIALPERLGLPAVLRSAQKEVARGPAAFRVGQPRTLSLAVRSRRIALAADNKEVLTWTASNGPEPPCFRLGIGGTGARTLQVGSARLTATVAERWAADELDRLRAGLRRQQELARKPWRPLFDGVKLDLWLPETGAWAVKQDSATVDLSGGLVLREAVGDDLEFRLKLQPLRAESLVRVAFRLARSGEHYGVLLGGGPPARRPAGCLALNKQRRGELEEVLARFGERVAWQPGKWYDLRVLAIGSELRADLDGQVLCIVRDDRRHRGTLALDVLHGGASFKDMALRALD